MLNKVFKSFDAAVADIPDGATIAIESWGIATTAHNLVAALKRKGTKDLTVITHNFIPAVLGEDQVCFPSTLLPQIKKLITPVVGIQQLGAGAFVKEYMEKGMEVELSSHGTMASRLYAGAARLGGIYNPVGVGTFLEEGKEKRVIDGVEYILEKPIRPDYAFIRGHKADRLGNLVYIGTFRGDQPAMAMAAKVTIAEVDEIVQVGDIDPEHVVTPGIFVDRIVKIPKSGLCTTAKRRVLINSFGEMEMARKMLFRSKSVEERPALVQRKGGKLKQRLDRDTIAMRAAKELKPDDYANLGVGIPQLCALYIPEGIIFQSENGVLGYGPLVLEDEIDKADFYLVDGGGRFITPAPGMALFDLLTSFAMIRGERLVTVLGGLQVSEKGDLAGWSNPSRGLIVGNIGGSMDLCAGAKALFIAMEHVTKDNEPKIVNELTYPATTVGKVSLIFTDLAVMEVTRKGLVLKEVIAGLTPEDVQSVTEPKLIISPDLKTIEF